MSRISEFWSWFGFNASALAADVENPSLLHELDLRVESLAPGLSWEIGPGLSKPWQFVISPNLDRDLRQTTRSIVAEAPNLEDWEIYSARQPKDWNFRVDLESGKDGEVLAIDATNWSFVLLQYPDGVREILLKSIELPILSEEERWQAGAIVLESVLGEDLILDAVDQFEILDEIEPQFAARTKPIQGLRAALMGSGFQND